MIDAAESILNYRFQNPELLTTALTHASHADRRIASNERLEFLGDAILGMVVCDELYTHFPDLPEGEMTKIKSTVVSRRTCATISNTTGLTPLLRLGKGMRTRDRVPASLAAAVFESVIGAIYLDGGIEPASAFILRHVQPFITDAADSSHQENFKSVLQQFAQKHLAWTPNYQLLGFTGPDHRKTFNIRVELGSRQFSPMSAFSKRAAEQRAAETALREMGVLNRSEDGQLKLISESDALELVPTLHYHVPGDRNGDVVA